MAVIATLGILGNDYQHSKGISNDEVGFVLLWWYVAHHIVKRLKKFLLLMKSSAVIFGRFADFSYA